MASTATSISTTTFAPMSATRLLIFGGIALIVAGMLFGDIFAVFVLHQNGGRTGETLLAAAQAAADRNAAGVRNAFANVGALLEDQVAGRASASFQLWTVMNAVLWHASWVEGREDCL